MIFPAITLHFGVSTQGKDARAPKVPEDLLEEVQYQDLPLLASIYFYNVWEMWANVGNKMELMMDHQRISGGFSLFQPTRDHDQSRRSKWLERSPWTSLLDHTMAMEIPVASLCKDIPTIPHHILLDSIIHSDSRRLGRCSNRLRSNVANMSKPNLGMIQYD